jgi:TRAP-type C4-dicarboxylate transport system permease small subunit
MQKLLAAGYRFTCVMMVICMVIMSVLVLTNTILRWFGTSIIISEEISRFLFVWMIFLGGIIAMADDIHIRVDLLTRRLPPMLAKALAFVGDVVMAVICVILMIGGYITTMLNVRNYAPVTEISMAIVYASVIISGLGMGIICLARAVKPLISTKKMEAAQ